MNELLNKNQVLIILTIALIMITAGVITNVFDDRTKIVYCDVGQGDAAYIRIKNKVDVLIDSGPDNKILSCLGKFMPFYDRTIELAFLSHPQSDHMSGFVYLLNHYKINNLFLPPIIEKTTSYQKFIDKISFSKINTSIGISNMFFYIKNDRFSILSPGENTCNEANNCSLIILFEEKNNRVLFTGDASAQLLNRLPKRSIEDLTILKIPHHGSKHGITSYFIQLANPQVSVISVGKNNVYGHPAKETLDILKASKTKILRTDKEGHIIIKL